jgi:hypothetical protein
VSYNYIIVYIFNMTEINTYFFFFLELLIFGTGKSVVPIPSHIKQHLYGLGIQTEVVDTVNSLMIKNLF